MQYKLHVWLRKTARRGFPESYRTGRSRGKKFTFSKATVPAVLGKKIHILESYRTGRSREKKSHSRKLPYRGKNTDQVARCCAHELWMGKRHAAPHDRTACPGETRGASFPLRYNSAVYVRPLGGWRRRRSARAPPADDAIPASSVPSRRTSSLWLTSVVFRVKARVCTIIRLVRLGHRWMENTVEGIRSGRAVLPASSCATTTERSPHLSAAILLLGSPLSFATLCVLFCLLLSAHVNFRAQVGSSRHTSII
jgi:hypothetical protein